MNEIIGYLVNELQMSEKAAKRNAEKLNKYDDIMKEFKSFIITKTFPNTGLIVEGYTARDIHNLAPFMNELGVYNFLVSLRDTPDISKKIIEDGFPLK